MLQPAGLVFALRVVVGPVHDAALVVPFVDAVELDRIADRQRVDARREVDVVRDQDRLPRTRSQDEALVAAAEAVVAEDARNAPAPATWTSLAPFCVRLGDRVVDRRRGAGSVAAAGGACRPASGDRRRGTAVEVVEDRGNGREQQQFLHGFGPAHVARRRGSGCQ